MKYQRFPQLAQPRARACKICSAHAPVMGAIDFNKYFHGWGTYKPALSGDMVFYNRCSECDFVFTSSLDEWTNEEFSQHIYNEFYPLMDACAAEQRPQANMRIVDHLFGAAKGRIAIADYGSGNGRFAQLLTENGFGDITQYDPFVGEHNAMPQGQFDLVTCYEVLEHTTDPNQVAATLAEMCKTPGVILFSTELQPADFDDRGLFWWYVNARAGHVSIHSRKSMTKMWEKHGFKFASFNNLMHVATRQVPDFASHLFG